MEKSKICKGSVSLNENRLHYLPAFFTYTPPHPKPQPPDASSSYYIFQGVAMKGVKG